MHDWWLSFAASIHEGIESIDDQLVEYRQHTNNAIGSSGFMGNINSEFSYSEYYKIRFWLGHNQATHSYVREERKLGKSKWTLSKKVKLFIDSFVSFSFAPIRFMSVVGFFTATLSFLYGIFVVLNALLGAIPLQGWTTLIALITFLLGLIIVMLGVIGEYLWRILDESRKRPSYIVDEIFE